MRPPFGEPRLESNRDRSARWRRHATGNRLPWRAVYAPLAMSSTASGWINSRKGTPLEVTPVRGRPYDDRPSCPR
jgi:hypothetical protein